jgi:uncharacterized protein (DUF488 family)
MRFYTTGYGERTLPEFLELLRAHGVKTLVDTRSVAVSRRREFMEDCLSAELEGAGIRYVHLPGLGCDARLRREARRKGDHSFLFRCYDLALMRNLPGLVPVIEKLEFPVVFMCAERSYKVCHRSRLTDALERYGWEGCEI